MPTTFIFIIFLIYKKNIRPLAQQDFYIKKPKNNLDHKLRKHNFLESILDITLVKMKNTIPPRTSLK